VIKALQSRMYLAEVYGFPDEVALEGGVSLPHFHGQGAMRQPAGSSSSARS
jgi:hypothetical protein